MTLDDAASARQHQAEYDDYHSQMTHYEVHSTWPPSQEEAIRAAVAEMRERCARLVEGQDRDAKRYQIADAIRALPL